MFTHAKALKRSTLAATAVLMSVTAISAWAGEPQTRTQAPAFIGHIEVTARSLRVADAGRRFAMLGQMTVTAKRISTALADGAKAIEGVVESAGESPTPSMRRSPRAVLVQ